MADNYARVTRWYDRVMGKTDKLPYAGDSNIVIDGDTIFSYGRHFEMARPLRDKRGKVEAFLVNGDVASVSTTRHQSYVRSAVRKSKSVIIPYSALESAGIDLDSIKILEVTPDRLEERRHQTSEMPEGARWRSDLEYRRRPATKKELQERIDRRNNEALKDHQYRVKWHADRPDIHRNPGEFIPQTVADLEGWDRYYTYHQEVMKLYTSGRGNTEINVTRNEDGTLSYEWTTRRHWLGESLIRAKVRWATSERCADCNGWGRGPNVDHWSSEEGACRTCRHRGRVTVRHERWATFLSGFDMEESRPLYFLAELPYRSKARTVAEAYEALKPEPVLLAEAMGREVQRQGDIFAVPTPSMDTRQLRKMGARIEKRGYILKTNHTATEVAYLPGGLTLVRGTMYHDPQGREPDHARHTLGKQWHVVVKNTVPTTKRRVA